MDARQRSRQLPDLLRGARRQGQKWQRLGLLAWFLGYDTVQLPQERAQPQQCLSLFNSDQAYSSAPSTVKEIQKFLS